MVCNSIWIPLRNTKETVSQIMLHSTVTEDKLPVSYLLKNGNDADMKPVFTTVIKLLCIVFRLQFEGTVHVLTHLYI